MYHQSSTVFRQKVIYIPLRKLLIKHIIDMPFVAPTGRVMSSLASHGGLASRGGIAGIGGGLAA